MFSSGYQRTDSKKILRHFAISTVVMMCFVVLFCVYYNPSINFHHFRLSFNYACPVSTCDEDRYSANTCSHEKAPLNGTGRISDHDTILLIWMWPFGNKYSLNCKAFNITRCYLTDDRSLYHRAHGVLFHHRDIEGNMACLPQEPRPWFQKWIWSNMESPANSDQVYGLNHLFNLTCTYRLDSSIPVPYGYMEPLPSEAQHFKLPSKDKLVCWIVSNWNAEDRVQFYNNLRTYVKVHVYGRAFGQELSKEDYRKIISSCKFYLSFENSVYKDYITEKLFRPMMLGSVPVVLGPSRRNYEDHIPSDSFIHINDFYTPKQLAQRLLYLDKNNGEYMKYFNWRKRYQVKLSVFGNEHACKTCSYLQKNRGYKAFHDLNKWYWGEQ